MTGTTKAIDLAKANRDLAPMTAPERVRWAVEQFGDSLVLSTSFGVQSAVMLHLVTQVKPEIPVIFIDTGYLFPETYRFAAYLEDRLRLNLKVYAPTMTAARQEAIFGKRWELDRAALEAYNRLNKVEPMNRAIVDLRATAWLAGLRRSQSSTRKALDYVSQQNRTCKINPILEWTDRDVGKYLTEHDLPYHPLWQQGYVSVGDWHSSSPLVDGMTPEETRYRGLKRECGLHELSGQRDWQI